MGIDKKFNVYNKGFESGVEHQQPSPKTLDELSSLKTSFALMNEKLDNIIDKISEVKTTLTDHIEKEYILHKEFQEGKAEKEDVTHLRNLVYGIYGGFFSISIAVIIYLLTK